jgi:hypothetical protein
MPAFSVGGAYVVWVLGDEPSRTDSQYSQSHHHRPEWHMAGHRRLRRALLARHPGLLQPQGLVSNRGEHTQAFYVLQKYYREIEPAK